MLAADSGEPFEAFVTRIEQRRYGPADVTIFTAHQMGSCRMGSDPADSVADGSGQLHDVAGVWIGDASAFPTAPGVEPDGVDHGARPSHRREHRSA